MTESSRMRWLDQIKQNMYKTSETVALYWQLCASSFSVVTLPGFFLFFFFTWSKSSTFPHWRWDLPQQTVFFWWSTILRVHMHAWKSQQAQLPCMGMWEHNFSEHESDSPKVIVWCTLIKNKVGGTFFFEEPNVMWHFSGYDGKHSSVSHSWGNSLPIKWYTISLLPSCVCLSGQGDS